MTNPQEQQPDPASPVVASYIVTFLKPEMLHVYRQVTGLQRWRNVVFCQKRENAGAFPFTDLHLMPKPASHQLRRFWQKTVLSGPVQIYAEEARKIHAELKKSGAKVLHVYFGHIGVHLLPLLEICEMPVVVSFHGADAQVDLHKPRHLAMTQRMLSLATLLLVRSESLAERLVALGCSREKIRVHRTGVPLDQLTFHQRQAPPDGAWRCVQACRLIAKKGLATSLKAFATFAAQYPLATFTVAGEGPQLEELRALAATLGIADRVRFSGFLSQSDLHALYAESHLFLHPSELGPDGDQEGVPNSMLEAMASGLPVLATQHGGIPEAVEGGVSGHLVPERDHATLAQRMLALAADASAYAAMSKAAAERVAARFDLRVTVPQLEDYYDEAVKMWTEVPEEMWKRGRR